MVFFIDRVELDCIVMFVQAKSAKIIGRIEAIHSGRVFVTLHVHYDFIDDTYEADYDAKQIEGTNLAIGDEFELVNRKLVKLELKPVSQAQMDEINREVKGLLI